jgi:acyl-CoA synthetase (AMP-forming)/AMP-acid ligase II
MVNAFLIPVLDRMPINLVAVWDPGKVLELTLAERLTVGGGVPYHLTSLLDHPDYTPEHLPYLRYAGLGGDGWLHTGDLGSLDSAGRLRIVGRNKDMFIVGGFNAYPAEIEGFLLEHPAIAQAAVIGVPDERLGQVGRAFVVTEKPVTEDELIVGPQTGWQATRCRARCGSCTHCR